MVPVNILILGGGWGGGGWLPKLVGTMRKKRKLVGTKSTKKIVGTMRKNSGARRRRKFGVFGLQKQ